MQVVLQRVSRASVAVDSEIISSIGPGLLLLVGLHKTDSEESISPLTARIPLLRIFDDAEGKMNRSLLDTAGAMAA